MQTPPTSSADATTDAGIKPILIAVALGVIFAVTLGLVALIAWAVTGFMAMGNLPENMGLGLGYIQMGLIPLAGILGAVFGFVLGVVPIGRAVFRWLIGLAVVIVVPALANLLLFAFLR